MTASRIPQTTGWLSFAGIVAFVVGIFNVIDGLVADEPTTKVPTLETDVLMGDAGARRRVAERTLDFALALQ